MSEESVTLHLIPVRVYENGDGTGRLYCQEQGDECPNLAAGNRWDDAIHRRRFLCSAHLSAWDARNN